MTKLKSELASEKQWYPPTCKAHLEMLNQHCSDKVRDRRDKLDVLSDLEYRAVAEDTSGMIRGSKHDRVKGTLKLTIKDSESGERTTVDLEQIVKFERMSEIPRKYQPR